MRTSSFLCYLFTVVHLLAVIACSEEETCTTRCEGSGGERPSGTGGGGGNAAGGSGEGGNASAPTVRVLDRFDAPGIGFDVLVHDKSGALSSRGLTDENGEVALEIPDGATVSVLFVDDYIQDQEEQTQRRIFSVATGGPAPGPLLIRYERMSTEVLATGMMSLGVTYPPAPGATKYTFASTCKRDPQYIQGTSATYPDVPICTPDGKYDLVVVGYDDQNTVVAWAALLGQTFEAGATRTHELSWSVEPLEASTMSAVNAPSGALSATFSTSAWQRNPTRSLVVSTTQTVSSPGSTTSATLPHAAAFGSSHCAHVSLVHSFDPDGSATVSQVVRCSEMFQSRDLTWDTSRLSAFPIPSVEVEPLTLTWGAPGDGAVGDAVIADASWGPSDARTIWRSLHRPAAGEVHFPALPADLAGFAPEPGVSLSAALIHQDSAVVEGFDEALATGLIGTDLEQVTSLAAKVTVP